MSRKYKICDQDKLYFVTFPVIHWLDVFNRQLYRDIFLDSLRYCQKHKGLELCAYCVMASHVHLIIGKHSEPSLENIIRDIRLHLLSALRGYNITWIVLYELTNTILTGIPKIIFSFLKLLHGKQKIDKVRQRLIEIYCRRSRLFIPKFPE